MDRRSAQWLDQHGIDLIETRNYEKDLHAAFYATWVKFQNEAQRFEFLSLLPRYDVKRRLEKNEAETRELKETLEMRRHRGDFDLSRVGDARQREMQPSGIAG